MPGKASIGKKATDTLAIDRELKSVREDIKANNFLTDDPQDKEEGNESRAEDGYQTFKSKASVNIFKCEDNSNMLGNEHLQGTHPNVW